MSVYRFEVPIRTVSGLNVREHWRARARRVKVERAAVALQLGSFFRSLTVSWPVEVTLTRRSPRALDDDNLLGALKGVRDEVAKVLGRDDRDPGYRWLYGQTKGPHAVLIEVRPFAAGEVVFDASAYERPRRAR